MNINGYIRKFGNKQFDEEPFNHVDSLILSELSYMSLAMVAPDIKDDSDPIKIKNVKVGYWEAFGGESVDASKNVTMFKLLQKSRRFRNISIGKCQTIYDRKKANQFFAVTFYLPNNVLYISYRGTDTSITGWKEDFNMTYMTKIPSQDEALEYAREVLSNESRKFYLGGHSKGGNLSFYTAFNLEEKYEKKLIKAYSFDGPGFRNIEEYQALDSFKRLENSDKLVKLVTNRSVIGMVFNDFKKVKAVVSTGLLFGGHDPFYWQVDSNTGKFKYAKKRSKSSEINEKAFNMWLNSLSEEDKKLTTQIVFEITDGVSDIYQLRKEILNTLTVKLNNALKKYSQEEQERLKQIVNSLGRFYLSSIKHTLNKSQRESLKKIDKTL